jgi:hypothetical protein
MAAIIAGYMSLTKLKEIVETLEGKGENGFKMTITVNDETNTYGQNVSMFAEQSKEQREAKADRYFCGNGKVIWTDGKVVLSEKKDKDAFKTPSTEELNTPTAKKDDDDLPF